MFLQTAGSCRVHAKRGELVLKNFSPITMAFTDRPARNATELSTESFDDGFAEAFTLRPNAVLTAQRADGSGMVRIAFVLASPDTDGIKGQLTYSIEQSDAQALASPLSDASGKAAGLTGCALFVDTVSDADIVRLKHGIIKSRDRQPVAYVFCGGGFTAMTGEMGVTRAIAAAGYMDRVTHLAGNSGGQWFAAQLVFSAEFFAAITDLTKPIDEVIQDWGRKYSASLKDFQATQGSTIDQLLGLAGQCIGSEAEDAENALLVLAGVILSSSVDLPMTEWYSFIEYMVKPWNFPPSTNATYANTPRAGLGDVTLLQMLALPPDAWAGNPVDKERAVLNVKFDTDEAQKMWDAERAPLLPVSHFSTKYSSGLKVPEIVKGMTLTGPRGATSSFVPPHDQTVLSVLSGSSAAGGTFGSPSMQAVFLETLGETASKILKDCSPLGFQDLAPPIRGGNGNSGAPDATWSPGYRWIDGGFIDNTAMPITIARLQEDCAAGRVRYCDVEESPPRLVLTSTDSPSNSEVLALFTDPSNPDFSTPGKFRPHRGGLKTGNSPVTTIFAETFPQPSEFTEFGAFSWTVSKQDVEDICVGVFSDFFNSLTDQKESTIDNVVASSLCSLVFPDSQGLLFKGCTAAVLTALKNIKKVTAEVVCAAAVVEELIGKTITSTANWWKGTVTTIDNPMFGVAGGKKYELLLLQLGSPAIDVMIFPGRSAEIFFQKVYGPIAKAVADEGAAVIKDFMEGA